jgi:hypothetical protein
MLQECYSRVKRWLKLQRSRVPHPVQLCDGLRVALPSRSIRQIALSVAFLLPVSSPFTFAQSPGQRPGTLSSTDYQLEFAAGATGRSQLGTAAVPLDDSYPAASRVWDDLLQDVVLTGLNLPFQWRLELVDDGSANAFSLPDGEVLVDRKLANLLGESHGLWAALLSHEIAHVARRHWLQRYSYQSKLRGSPPNSGIVTGMDGRWRMAVFDQQMDAPDSLSKFSHELEFEADNEGMMLMARTGYHPDFELALHHLMEASFAEAPGSISFSTHPHWISREHNSQKAYRTAVEEFERHWTIAGSSPGGAPPTVVFLGEPKSSRQEPSQVSFSVRCVNPGQELKSVLTIYERAGKGSARQEAIEFWEPTTCNSHEEKKIMTITLPADRRNDSDRKGQIRILNPEGIVLERSNFFPIHAEKIDKQRSSLDAFASQHPLTRN